MDLPRLVDLAADRLGVAVEYDAAIVKGTVTLRIPASLSDTELWDLTNRVLAARGFTTVRVRADGPLSVVKLSDAAALASIQQPLAAKTDAIEAGFVTTVVRAQSRSAKELAEAVKTVLSKPGGNAAPLGEGGLIVISDLAPRVDQAMTLLKLLDVPAGEITVEEVPTKNLPASQLAILAAQVLAKRLALSGDSGKGEPSRPGILRGDVVASPGGTGVLVVAPKDLIPAWRELLLQLDQREPVETVTYAPRSFQVGEVGKLVEQVAHGAVGGTAGAIGGVTADDRWHLVTDDLTGTLIVTATPSQHEKIKALMERLESVPSEARRPVRSFMVRNRPVTQIVEVLNKLMEAGVLETAGESADGSSGGGRPSLQEPLYRTPPSSASGLTSSARPPAATSWGESSAWPLGPTASGQPGRSGDGGSDQRAGSSPRGGPHKEGPPPLSLTADEGTNTLIAIGEPRLLAQIEKLLVTLDVRQPQVMLEVMLVSLTQAQTLDLGIELERVLTHADDTKIRLASLFGLSTSDKNGGRAVGDAAGFIGTVLNPGEFAVIVRALQGVNSGRSLSAPQVLVNNNQQATISALLQQPFVSTNASSTVATTSFGGTQDAGTQLTIRPQIAAGDHLILDYSVTLSSFVGSSGNAALPPPRQQNTVKSTLTIPDGYTVVVGGLQLESQSKSKSQVPLLGDVPILGELFKNRSNSNSTSKFYVFIRAGVQRSNSFEDLKYLSDLAAATMGVDDGFPEVEPQEIR